MDNHFDLARFLKVQDINSTYSSALAEIKSGRKMTHWMWFIFPQISGLGRSETAVYYSIKSKEEAIAYWEHPQLKSRLVEITEAILRVENRTAHEILGGPDDLKLKSSMTLFHLIQDEKDLFQKVLDKYFDGKISYRTKELIG